MKIFLVHILILTLLFGLQQMMTTYNVKEIKNKENIYKSFILVGLHNKLHLVLDHQVKFN